MINGIKTVRHTHLTINKEVGVYDFGNSALSRSSTGSKIWKSYHNNPKNKKFVECEKL